MFVLIIMALFLSIALYAKKDENGTFLKNHLGIDVNFSSFNKTINKLLDFRVIDNVIEDVPVANIPNYIHMGNDNYVNGGSEVTSIDDGVVTYIYEDETGYLVIVENDSGFRSVYSNLLDVNVKVNDRIYFDSVIGVVEEQVNIVFSKNNEKITYEQVLELL
jgi:murein DD-endopeptidase MepM/ murein hydrolase activator NlpD